MVKGGAAISKALSSARKGLVKKVGKIERTARKAVNTDAGRVATKMIDDQTKTVAKAAGLGGAHTGVKRALQSSLRATSSGRKRAMDKMKGAVGATPGK